MSFLDQSKDSVPSLNVEECLAMLAKEPKLLLLDVRRLDEYEESHIPGSMHLELAQLLDGQWENLLPYKECGIVVQCRSGARSLKAAQFLATQGFTKLWNMAGGILAYQDLQK